MLILDEPTAALNDTDSAHLLGLIDGLREHGITSIIISHKLNEIKAIADRVTVIRDGRTIETLDLHADEISEERIIRGMVGRDLESRFPEREATIGDEVLRIEDWTVHHPLEHSRVVVDHANLYVRAGEVVGIAGLMGAGRTELAMSVFGHSYGRDISGRLYKNGQPIQANTVKAGDRARHRVRDGGPQALRPQPDRRHQAQHLRLGAGQARPAGATSTPTPRRSWRTATARACGSRRPTSG